MNAPIAHGARKAALAFILLLVLVAVFAPLIVKAVGAPEPNVQDPNALDDFGLPAGPSSEHLFGVDQIGRDVFARTIYGARVSLTVALIATALIVVIGTVAGMVAGFYRGWIDSVLSRIMDVQLAFPVLLLALGLGAACSLGGGCLGGIIEPGLRVVIFVIVLAQWPYFARIIRGQVLSLREKEFIEAARSLGASNTRINNRTVLVHTFEAREAGRVIRAETKAFVHLPIGAEATIAYDTTDSAKAVVVEDLDQVAADGQVDWQTLQQRAVDRRFRRRS